MQCSVESNRNSGKVKMKTIDNYKNPYMKETNLDNIVDQLCMRLQDIKDREGASRVGMPTCSNKETEAVRRYYAAFPALKKGQESPLPYYLPPPAWCRKSADTKLKMQCELSVSKDWINKNKKFSTGKERRNSYHGQRKNNKKRCNSYSRSFESKESLPEWVTHEGVWDMETQDSVKEFIRAIAFDEGYGTCENTVTDEIKEITQVKIGMNDNMVPDWDDSLDLAAEWIITEDLNPRIRSPMEEELYAKFEAKFDRSIEALWSKDQNTPDDEYQDLPIDFQDLLSSPSDRLFADASAEKCSLISFSESIWSAGAAEPPLPPPPPPPLSVPQHAADALHDRLRPLHLADSAPPPRDLEPFALYDGDEVYDALASVASTMRSFAAINHSRERSGFVEVPPRRTRPPPPPPRVPAPAAAPPAPPSPPGDEAQALFRPIRPARREPAPPRYADGDTFDIRGDPDPVPYRRSASGGVYVGAAPERYLEYRLEPPDGGLRLRFPLKQRDAAAQTEPPAPAPAPAPAAAAWAACEECGRAAKKMRPSGAESIWSTRECTACAPATDQVTGSTVVAAAEELSREWDELLHDIGAAHARYAGGEVEERGDRKRRHSAALRCAAQCTHPHARFLPCCTLALDRPLTR